ncbi:MAG TPA: phosphate acetyltransferase [Candidatus Aminicenantes bacterium]|nr:phosphate acetyltransferase [Candidatus Aminicenantes bacterium]
MADNLYVTSTERKSGKSVISLGLTEMLIRNVDKVAFFRPLIYVDSDKKEIDNDINLISDYYHLDIPYDRMYGFSTDEANEMLSQGKYDELIEKIVTKYKYLEENYDFVLCEGTDFEGATSAFEFDINADIANNLGCPVVLSANAYNRSEEGVIRSVETSLESFIEKHCKVVAIIVNRAEKGERIVSKLKDNPLVKESLVFSIPNIKSLQYPTVGEVAKALNARVVSGQVKLNRHVEGFGVAAMQLRNVLTRVSNGDIVITPGDRADIIVGCLSALSSSSMPSISGIILTGGLIPQEPILKLIEGYDEKVPILSVKENTFETARMADNIHAVIDPDDTIKVAQALEAFEKNVELEELREKIIKTKVSVVTPKMFEYRLIKRAQSRKQHIVLPEGEDERILQAAEILTRREVVDLTLLGNEKVIRDKIAKLGLQLDKVNIVDVPNNDKFEDYAQTYYELRKHKGLEMDNAHDIMSELSYFGTMMVYKGDADGMVSGAVHTTRNTLRPAFEFIKTKKGFSIISSVFFMCLPDRVLVYGDCAVNPDPNEDQLAEIAIASAQTAVTFNIQPIVAMLSYSTGDSGVGEDVEKVKEATKKAREMAKKYAMDLKIEGPIQYDAAIDPGVAKAKLPRSDVAGRATVFIFPDLNTGNNTYKAVQRSAGAVAIGPVLQGLNRPVNDLSRGCTVTDIFNTVAITAIQAQAKENKS